MTDGFLKNSLVPDAIIIIITIFTHSIKNCFPKWQKIALCQCLINELDIL